MAIILLAVTIVTLLLSSRVVPLQRVWGGSVAEVPTVGEIPATKTGDHLSEGANEADRGRSLMETCRLAGRPRSGTDFRTG